MVRVDVLGRWRVRVGAATKKQAQHLAGEKILEKIKQANLSLAKVGLLGGGEEGGERREWRDGQLGSRFFEVLTLPLPSSPRLSLFHHHH